MPPKLTPAQHRTELWNAMRLENHAEAVSAIRLAVANGANPNDGYGVWIPLGWAIRNKAIEVARLLVDLGADINVLENRKSLLGMCLASPDLAPLVEFFIDRGAKPSAVVLAIAAKRGNERMVQWSLDAGLDPNNLQPPKAPILTLWPGRKPIPECLLQASFRATLSDATLYPIASLITRRKNLNLLQVFIDRAKGVSQDTRRHLLHLAIEARWKAGLELLLETKYANPLHQIPRWPSLVASFANWINASQNSTPGLKALDRLLRLGCDINATHRLYQEGGHEGVDAFLLLAQIKATRRAALFSFLRERNLRPVFVASPGGQTKTLAHALIHCQDWELLRQLPALYPGVQWEHEGAPGLLSTWAVMHAPVDRRNRPDPQYPIEDTLAIVQALPGFDLHRRDLVGHSGLRTFLLRPGGHGFSKITTHLLQAGLDPSIEDREGISDLDFVARMNLAPGLREDFQALALQLKTRQSSNDGSASVRRL